MTVELITGYSGTPHIGSDDVQHLLAGIVGGGSYALDTGKKLAIAVNSANSVTVDTGDAIIAGGAHVRVAAAEKLTVTSGAQGVKRNDLVCLRYTKASDNKESAALVVVKGTATSGTPADPAVNTGSIIDGKATVDMPLYRLPLNGVSLGTPVKLFSVSPTLASLGESVSPRHLGGGNVTILGCTIKVDCWLFATSILIVKLSHVSGSMSSPNACEISSNAAFTLPENLRPKTDIRVTAFTSLRFSKSVGAMVEPSGAVKLYFSTSARIEGYGFETCACFIPLAI